MSEHGFLVFCIESIAAGTTMMVVYQQNFCANGNVILIRSTKAVFLATFINLPNTYLPLSAVRRLCACLPQVTMLVLDAIYAE